VLGAEGYAVGGATDCGLTATAGCETTGAPIGDVVSLTERPMRAPDCTTGSGGIAVGTSDAAAGADAGVGAGGSMLVHAAIVS